jgi:hypothetical protein
LWQSGVSIVIGNSSGADDTTLAGLIYSLR